MHVEELKIDNIRSFEDVTLKFTRDSSKTPHNWVTFLGENGGGKSTALQALGLLLAGPVGAGTLLPRPSGWVRDEDAPGKISVSIRQGRKDPGVFDAAKTKNSFRYSYAITGSKSLKVNKTTYTEPSIIPHGQASLSWLRNNAFSSKGTGWFAAGYGAFRRLTRSSRIDLPSLEPPARYRNFSTQFDESEPLSVFERWVVYLDYKMAKSKDKDSEPKRQFERGIEAINQILPSDARFDKVTPEGRILITVGGRSVPTIALSDGYRSVLALAGDLVWRLLQSFPKSQDPLKEEGVVLIDELDIHLHPIWQRDIAGVFRKQFPKIQFIVATHSPLIAAGAGEDALTYRFLFDQGRSSVEKIANVSAMNVERILQSEAFGLVSPFSPQTQEKIDRYDTLSRKGNGRTEAEDDMLQELKDFMKEANRVGGPPKPDSLEAKLDEYLTLKVMK